MSQNLRSDPGSDVPIVLTTDWPPSELSMGGLWTTIGGLIDLFTPQECANYFAAAGYDPD